MKMSVKKLIGIFILLVIIPLTGFYSTLTAQVKDDGVVKLENPLTVQYLKSNLRKSTPRLVLTPAIEANLKAKVKSDPVVKAYYEAMKLNASEILSKPVLTRVVVGRRLLSTSREMLYRMTVLSMLYRLDKDPAYLKKIDEELNAVCNFTDWNPSHFLDVAEMSLAVSIAVDWAGGSLPKTTVELAKKNLIEKGLIPSQTRMNYNSTNNWNQVCNGGMIAAAITIAEKDPELAAKTISKSLDGMPNALKQYAPDGVYPEGATYWDYGTSFSVVTSSFLESAFGTDFGIAAYPAFLKSADFKKLSTAPSGWYFNFADCGDRSGRGGDVILAWFAYKTGNSFYFEKEKFLLGAEAQGKLSRLAGPGLVWLSQFTPKSQVVPPLVWKGDGSNPIFVFRGGDNDPRNYYFGGKGGRGNLSHGNMDAGSFVFELDGVRWSVDPGVQDYNALEQAGFDLWNQTQNSPRWTLVTKGNHGHSTLTVDNALFKVDATCRITDFKTSPVPTATVDMSPVFAGHLGKATRIFTKDTDHSIVIEDQLVLLDSTKTITWAMMTQAEVVQTPDGAILIQDGKKLHLKIISPASVWVSTIMMDPAPTKLDKRIENLKRIEIRVPAYIFNGENGVIKVRLTSPE